MPLYLKTLCDDGLQRYIQRTMAKLRSDRTNQRLNSTLAMLMEEKSRRLG